MFKLKDLIKQAVKNEDKKRNRKRKDQNDVMDILGIKKDQQEYTRRKLWR